MNRHEQLAGHFVERLRILPALLLLFASACKSGPKDAGFVLRADAATQTAERNAALDTSRRTAIVDAASQVGPSVVSINAMTRRQVETPSMFDFFIPQTQEQLVPVGGTGFIIRADGVIITNQHVVAGAERVIVTLRDGTDLPARVLGEDPITDIAVLKVERAGLPTARIGRSRDLLIGEWVVALGNPFAFLLGNSEPTVTAGVISASGRNILPTRDQAGLYLDMIQTDAAINPGNSGGPLANSLGEIIGVNSSIFSSTGGSVGLGFAIPIERAMRVADEIVRNGEVRRAWVGLEVAGAESMADWKAQGGVVVVSVAPGGPAARAQINPRDVLVEANGRKLRNFLDWEAVKLDLHVGDSVRLRLRQGSTVTDRLIVTGDLPTVTSEKVSVLRGIDLITVTPGVRAERGLRSDQGALIFRITSQIAQATGLRSGDVILAVNRTMIRRAEDVGQIFSTAPQRQPIRVHIERAGQYAFTDLVFR
ncbi:MAG: trypsin-like peptidase domain-containing protein [Gemmatimonadota bacterium]